MFNSINNHHAMATEYECHVLLKEKKLRLVLTQESQWVWSMKWMMGSTVQLPLKQDVKFFIRASSRNSCNGNTWELLTKSTEWPWSHNRISRNLYKLGSASYNKITRLQHISPSLLDYIAMSRCAPNTKCPYQVKINLISTFHGLP